MYDIQSGDYNAASGQPHDDDRVELTASGHPTVEVNFAAAPDESGDPGKGDGSAHLLIENDEFVATVMAHAIDGKPVIVSIGGVPSGDKDWSAIEAKDIARQCPPDRNNYLNISCFTADDSGKIRARRSDFASMHVAMLDDVGTKVPLDRLKGITPSCVIETSPGNTQWLLFLKTPITDLGEAEQLVKMLVAEELTDKGAGGAARWFRMPVGINGKPQYQQSDGSPWSCRLIEWHPEITYEREELISLLKLKVPEPKSLKPSRSPSLHEGSEVFQPRADDNAVIAALKEKGLYKRRIDAFRHDITCPWCSEHTNGLDTGAAYFEPSPAYPLGGFKCQHAHGDRYHIRDLIEHLQIDEQAARHKDLIRLIPGPVHGVIAACEMALARLGGFYQSGGLIVKIRIDPATGAITTVPANEAMLTLALAEAVDFEKPDGRTKAVMVRCDPPTRTVYLLARAENYDHLPVLNGIAYQPFFREDGSLVTQPGYDEQSGIYASFDAAAYDLPDPTPSEADRAHLALQKLVGEFHFSTPRDQSTAICAMLTAVVRPSLPLAPGFNTTATMSGSGKSYLNSVITSFVGPSESIKTSYPATAEEATKSILSMLLSGTPAIEFDDMPDHWKPHGMMNRLFTAPKVTDRILGVSKIATVSTRCLVMGSGNNIEPQRDLRRRVLTIKLDPRCATPATLSYSGNPLVKVRKHRERYVVAALTIIRAWIAAGSPRADVPSIASFDGLWSDWCRQPLLWLGLPDPAGSIIEQVTSDPENDVIGNLLGEWFRIYGTKPVMVRTIIADITKDKNERLFEALEESPAFERDKLNSGKLGWYLKRIAGRVVDGMIVEQVKLPERTAWRVVPIDTPSPAMPAASLAADPGSPDI